MALKYPDRLESNNPKAYGIVKAVEIAGHKTVKDLASLYTIADCILSDSKNNLNNDAIGQEWYVIDENAYYKLVSWENRTKESGWAKRDKDITEHIANTDIHVTAQNKKDWNAKYNKPSGGIPKSDLSSDIQTSLSKADSALQEHQSLENYATTSSVTTALQGKVDKVANKGLSTNDYTTEEKTKLSGIEEGAQKNLVSSVAGRAGAVTLSKSDVGLKNVDNTADTDKPVSTAQKTAIEQALSDSKAYVDKKLTWTTID